jgi:hypothetical protein
VYAFDQRHRDAFHSSLESIKVNNTVRLEESCPGLPQDRQSILVDQIQHEFREIKVTAKERKNIPHIELVGLRGSVQQAQSAVLKRYKAFLVNQQAPSFPLNWAPQRSNLTLFNVGRDTKEFNNVTTRLRRTMPTAQITRLQRVQNKSLWTSFQAIRQSLETKLGRSNISERLFHGSGSTPPQTLLDSDICFDRNFSNQGMWGRGLYFAVNASYSNDYAHTAGNERQFFLADVLVGEWMDKPHDTNCTRLVRIVDKHPGTGNDYDSYRGNTNGSNIFILYRDSRAYPTYLITYTTS